MANLIKIVIWLLLQFIILFMTFGHYLKITLVQNRVFNGSSSLST